MHNQLENLPHIIVITLSIVWCSYTSYVYTSQIINSPFAIALSATLAVLAHVYMMMAIQALRKRKLTAAIIVALLMSGAIITADLKGVHALQYQATIEPVESAYKAKVEAVDLAISNSRLQAKQLRDQLATLTTSNNNWKDHSNAGKLEKQLVTIQQETSQMKDERATLVSEMESELGKASATAEDLTTSGQGFSIVVLILSSLVSMLIRNASSADSPAGNVAGKAGFSLAKSKETTLIPTANSKQSEAPRMGFEQAHLTQDKVQLLTELWEEGHHDSSTLLRELNVNAKRLKELKILAGIK